MTKVSPSPFGVVAASDRHWIFVALGSSVGVVRNVGGLPGPLAGQVRLPRGQVALGETLTRDGRYLLVANSLGGADVLSVRKTERRAAGSVLGVLSGAAGLPLHGAIEVAVSRDDKFAFVSVEYSKVVAVYALGRALARGFGPSDFVGTIPVGIAPVGMAISRDGRWLYVTSEIAAGFRPGEGRTFQNAHGTLSVISVSKAEADPSGSVVATVDAGCQPVRVITSIKGDVVWVTARASDALLAYSADRLVSAPQRAFIAGVRVGEAPVGLALVNAGSRIVVADSNRFGAHGASASLAVVDVPKALAGRRSLLGYLPAGTFPREMAVLPGSPILLVSNFGSAQLESVKLADLP